MSDAAPAISYEPGLTVTQFHYNGVTTDLDSQWSSKWYMARLEKFLEERSDGEVKWGWFYVDQRAGTTFTFLLSENASYAFTVRDYAFAEDRRQIDDPRITN